MFQSDSQFLLSYATLTSTAILQRELRGGWGEGDWGGGGGENSVNVSDRVIERRGEGWRKRERERERERRGDRAGGRGGEKEKKERTREGAEERQTDRQRERERQRQTEKQRQTDREGCPEKERKKGAQREREGNPEREREKGAHVRLPVFPLAGVRVGCGALFAVRYRRLLRCHENGGPACGRHQRGRGTLLHSLRRRVISPDSGAIAIGHFLDEPRKRRSEQRHTRNKRCLAVKLSAGKGLGRDATLKSERTTSRHHIGRKLNSEKYLELQPGVQTLGGNDSEGTRGTML